MTEPSDENTPTIEVNYADQIPNNVNLYADRRLQRAMEKWHPKFLEWWNASGPNGFQTADVYLRTAVGVDPKGWAVFDHVRMPDYRWGILLANKVENRKIGFGRHKGESAWQEVPGEYRSLLKRLLIIQGDTEPASVEQQRYLGKTCPSLYDLRNLFQVNVEEGRHLWAMAYLLQKYFGRDGREEAEALLERRSGSTDKPRLLGAFNEKTPDWLSFFMFTFFTDRDGKMQLESLAQSGFDPLSRTCRFMLTEEAHHMYVGESGVARTMQRTAQAMAAAGITDPHDIEAVRKLGVVDLPTLQKKVNFHFSVTLDLFGSEISTNAGNAYSAGIKGRFREDNIDDDHQLMDSVYPVLRCIDNQLQMVEEPAISAINARLLDDYISNVEAGLKRWNRVLEKTDLDFTIMLPHRAFNRHIGEFGKLSIDPNGNILTAEEWQQQAADWLPSEQDESYLQSLMQPVMERGTYAKWIAAPKSGINKKPGDFEYVVLQ